MTKLNKTNLGVAGDGTSVIVVNDTGKWGAPSGANHYRFVAGQGLNAREDNVQQLYKGPFGSEKATAEYVGTFDSDDPAWKFQGTIDSCEGATNDGQVPGPTLGSEFIWKFWLNDQTLLNNVASGSWDPSWYIELLDPNQTQHGTYLNPDQTYKVEEVTFEPESDWDGSTASGERSIGILVDETQMWWRDPLTRSWGVFQTSDDEPKLTVRIWQKLPYMASVDDAKTFWNNIPSHEETIYLRDAVIPHLCEIREGSEGGTLHRGYNTLQMGETYYLKHRYFGPARYNNTIFKVATSIFMEPGGQYVQDIMGKNWMTDTGNFGLSFYDYFETYHWFWWTSFHSTLYDEYGAAVTGGYQTWVVPEVADGTWQPDYYVAQNRPQYWIGGGPINPSNDQYEEQVNVYGTNKNLFEPSYAHGFNYSARREIDVYVEKEFEITNDATGGKVFYEDTPATFKVRMKHVPPDSDGVFSITLQNVVTLGSFGPEDINWSNTNGPGDVMDSGWVDDPPALMLYDSDKTLVNGMHQWISPQITFTEDFELEEQIGDGGTQDIQASLYINGTLIDTDDIDIESYRSQQNLWLYSDVDLGKTMPVAAWGKAQGDPVRSIHLIAGARNGIEWRYSGFNQDWWDQWNPSYPGLQEPLIKDGELRWSYRRAGALLPAGGYIQETMVSSGVTNSTSLTMNNALVGGTYDNNPENALVNTKAQYDWLGIAGNDLYLVASTGADTGADEEIIGVWLIEPLYPSDLTGDVATAAASTTDPATIPVLDEDDGHGSFGDRPRLYMTMRNRDGDLPTGTDVRDIYHNNIQNINAYTMKMYINVGNETTHADENDFEWIYPVTYYSDDQPAGVDYYTLLDFYYWGSNESRLCFALKEIVEDDPIEGRQVVTLDLGIGDTVLGDDQNMPVDYNGDLLSRARFTLNDDYLFSNITVSFQRITSTDDYDGTWPHGGQGAPHLNYPEQDEIGGDYCYKGQGMKMTVDMSHADIPAGTKVSFRFQGPSTDNVPAPGWTLDAGYFYKEFEKTAGTDTFTAVSYTHLTLPTSDLV